MDNSSEAHMFEPLKVAPAYRVLYDTMLRKIMSGALRSGTQLPTEQELCEQFGVNRSTVREGIRVLEQTGYLRREGGKRLVISRPTQKDVGDQLERAMILDEITFLELWEAALVLEPQLAVLAARKLSAEDCQALERNLERTAAAVGRGDPLVALDLEFHALVARATGNRALQLFHEALLRVFYPAFSAVISKVTPAGQRLLRAHQEIYVAMKEKDFDRVSLWMGKHQRDFKRGFELAALDIERPIAGSVNWDTWALDI
jgi:DNA-binding FadR family transcriptional regulator